MLRIKLVKSPIGNTPRNRGTVAALGLRKMNQTVEHNDTPMIRGMIHHVKHLLEVTEVEGEPTKKQPWRTFGASTAAKPAKPVRAPKPAAPKAEKPAKAKAAPAAAAPAKPAKAEAKATETTEDAKPKRTTKKKTEEK